MHLPPVQTPAMPKHRVGISCQPDTLSINVSANLTVTLSGVLRKWNFKSPTFTLASCGCSDAWLGQSVAGMSRAQAEVLDKVNWTEVLCCPSSPWRWVLLNACLLNSLNSYTNMLWGWAFQHFLSSIFLLFKITVWLSTSHGFLRHFLKMSLTKLVDPELPHLMLCFPLMLQGKARAWSSR